MEKQWNLDKLYPDFDSREFAEDKKNFLSLLKEINSWSVEQEQSPVQLAEKFINKLKKCYFYYSKLVAYSRLTVSVNAEDERAQKEVEKLEKKITELTRSRVRFQKWLSELDDRAKTLYENSALLAEHEFFLEELAAKSQYLLSEEEEELAARLQQTGSSAWSKLHQRLTSTLTVTLKVEGEKKELPLSEVRNMAYDKNADIRKKAYEAEIAAYDKIEKGGAAALNAIKGEVLTMTEKRGYDSPLEKTLKDSRMEEKTLETLIEAIENSLSDFRKYLKKKAEILGHKKGLPFYDLFAPVGEVGLEFEYEEAAEFIVKNIRPLSSEMADFFKKAFSSSWIDALPRANKRGGAFCYPIHPIQESRVMANFTGSFSNMLTLAHELGHAYHGHCLKEESILNTDYPMPLAETASIFSETAVHEAALEEASPEERLVILENHLSGATQIIVDIYSRFIFEKELFAERKEASLSSDELQSLMIQAQKEAYGDVLDEEHLHPYMWLNKSHYYSAGQNYYNFPYAFGFLFGLGVYALKEDNDNFMEKYKSLLKVTGKKKISEVAKQADINPGAGEFWEKSLDKVREDITLFIKLADEYA